MNMETENLQEPGLQTSMVPEKMNIFNQKEISSSLLAPGDQIFTNCE